ncbi:MAG TPA: FHA domain-containing protein [Thermoanaerobaculia bacterium]|nr:FHA domain-containing protein [Thermoanaerobaculia bacterium]
MATAFSLLHGAREYPLRDGDQLIGRGREVDIPLFTALTSRHHARIRVADQKVILEDLGSMNGTRVNQEPVSGSIELKLGDQIEIGGELLVLWSPASPTKPARQPKPDFPADDDA